MLSSHSVCHWPLTIACAYNRLVRRRNENLKFELTFRVFLCASDKGVCKITKVFKMFDIKYFLVVLALAASTHSSPTNTENVAPTNPEEISNTQEAAPSLENQYSAENTEPVQGQRQKRWYNYYGFPPVFPNPARDTPSNFGVEDPLIFIHRRLQEIANVARQPPQPPTPVFLPVIFVPVCNCNAKPKKNQTEPSLPEPETRFPEMEDERQNWGFVMNDTDDTDSDDGDGSRPISFVPIDPSKPVRPAPPVEHGSSQAGSGPQESVPAAPASQGSSTFQGMPTNVGSTTVPVTQAPDFSKIPDNPSVCDGAVLSCCHQPQVTYDCFVAQGCPDPTSYGNPCDSRVILSVIQRFQRFYGQRTK